MEALSLNNIVGEQGLGGLFEDDGELFPAEEEAGREKSEPEEKENSETVETTEVVSPDSLFEGDIEEEEQEQPESVGSEKDKVEKVKGDSSADDGGGTSPNENFYSSIAKAAAVDGVFPNLDEETINKVSDAESFSELFDLEVSARLDETQKRIAKALENGVEPSLVRQYEGTLDFLNKVTDAQLADESGSGEQLRQRIIYQDLINKGYKPEKAERLTQRAIDNGTDVEDAKEALQNNKEYFQEQYDKVLKQAQKDAEKEKAERQKMEAKLKNDIMEDKQLMGGMELSAETRRKVYDAISKPVYKDPETGQYMTALQRYETEHHADFMKYVSLFWTLTNGFKDFDSLTKGKVRKEVNKGIQGLEAKLRGNTTNQGGGFRAVNSLSEDPESFIGSGFKLHL